MKLRQYGYQLKNVEVREMAMCDVVTCISQALIEKKQEGIEIHFVDMFMGEVTIYSGIKDMLIQGIATTYKVNVYNICVMHDNMGGYDYVKVLMADEIDDVNTVLIEK